MPGHVLVSSLAVSPLPFPLTIAIEVTHAFGGSGAAGCRADGGARGRNPDDPYPVVAGLSASALVTGGSNCGRASRRNATRAAVNARRVAAIAGTVFRSSVPRSTPSMKANAAYPTATISRESNDPNWFRPARSSGPAHQVTSQPASPATAMAASPETASRAASQGPRETSWVHASRNEPDAISPATSGAPQNTPRRPGATTTRTDSHSRRVLSLRPAAAAATATAAVA